MAGLMEDQIILNFSISNLVPRLHFAKKKQAILYFSTALQ